METCAFLRYQVPPTQVHWCYNDGILLVQYKHTDYFPRTDFLYGDSLSTQVSVDDVVEMKLSSLACPNLDYIIILANHPSTTKSLRKILKNKFWVPIMVFVALYNELGICLYNRKSHRTLFVRSEVLCDLKISFQFRQTITSKLIQTIYPELELFNPTDNLPSYKIRFSKSYSFPDGIVDFEDADAIITAYDSTGQTIADYVLAKSYGDANVFVHQYLYSS